MRTTRFTVAMPRPETHLYEITMEVDPRGAASIDLVLPVWTPGSYLVREFSRHVRDLTAKGKNGRPVAVEKVAKNTWRLTFKENPLSPLSSLSIRYRVYAHELTVRTSHLDSTHGYGNGANLFFYVEGRKDEPQEVRFDLPRGWKTSMALPARGGVLRAADYDELVDSPFECGRHRTFPFSVHGVPHTLALWGRGNEDAARVVRDLKKIVAEASALFGGLPYERYLFLVHLSPAARGGLEHRASQTVALGPHVFRPEKSYRDALLLFSHELFHAWNVKRIRPEAFGPIDYGREVHTKDLWALEGITSYYETLLLLRAGLLTEAQAFEQWTTHWKGHLETPGRKVQSAEMASFDAWIRFYRPDENSPNVSESYYRRGALLGLALDLTLRRATGRRRGLDDVMRRLFRSYAAKGKGYPPGAVEEACVRVAGARPLIRAFFDRYVRGTGTPDLARLLLTAGLRLREVAEAEEGVTDSRPPRVRATFGWRTKAESGRLVVAEVVAGGPAERGGVNAGDLLVAVDGLRATEELVARLEKERKPGSRVAVTVFRRDVLETYRVGLGARRASVWRIEALADAPAGAR
ncbi:MAG: PDZ domain-containing protein, partial [Thermoanaerobaculia bacterium]|nr:PDZ domain-containing protein [Thermoanaerobaculia bacterium]